MINIEFGAGAASPSAPAPRNDEAPLWLMLHNTVTVQYVHCFKSALYSKPDGPGFGTMPH
jgi:hypothetical protein